VGNEVIAYGMGHWGATQNAGLKKRHCAKAARI